ncbi:TetR/AcrR family transcriptional regulator [Nocardioides sp.]|uniref:TetR/AcrR family transcriptional regulator n=1 Tax=Nocardioides sp. TaxID=35761 RepID=UPI00260FF392|nr:TetR/AcrR family transcriptional regulator [Nocardioides sp.]
MTEPDRCRTGLRADAERNRVRILETACRLFAESGLDVPLEDIARQAGVGIATLYRRYPTRGDLAAAVFAEQLWRYGEVVDRADVEADPWQAMVTLVHGLSDLQGHNAGLREFLTMSFSAAPEVQAAFVHVQERLEEMIARIVASGVVRPDFDRADLMLFMIGNGALVARLDEVADQARRRLAALFLEGIRNRPDATVLPVGPTATELRRAVDPFAR